MGFLHQLMSTIALFHGTRYSDLAGTTLILYDQLITIDQEVNYLWKSRWSLCKVLFLVIRYYNMFIVSYNTSVLFWPEMSDSSCLSWIRWQWFTGIFVTMCTEIILMQRVYAMYGQSKKILIALITAFSIACTVSIIVIVMETSGERATDTPTPLLRDFHTCYPVNEKRTFYLFWVPFVGFETFTFLLALFKGYQSFRSNTPKTWFGRAALDILIRDSILYYLVVFLTYILTILMWAYGGIPYEEIPVSWAIAVSTVAAQRLVLNIRSSMLPMDEDFNIDSRSNTPIVWAPPVFHKDYSQFVDEDETYLKAGPSSPRNTDADLAVAV